MTFKAYMDNIQAKTGTPEDIWKLAIKKHFGKQGKIVAKHAELLAWLKSEIGLGHVHGNFIISYLRLRADDPKVSTQSRSRPYKTGYQELK